MNDEQRAERDIRRGQLSNRGPGRPLKGNEPRVRVNLRLEPTLLQKLNALTDRSAAQNLEAMYEVLELTMRYRSARELLLSKLESLLALPVDKAS